MKDIHAVADQDLVELFNAHAAKFLGLLGGRIVAVDPETASCTLEYNISTDYCHSGDIVQGGFITSMLDSAMTHAAFAGDREIVNLSSLEIKTNYLEATRAGRLTVVGKVIRGGYKLAFMEGQVFDEDGVLTATASTVAKLIRKK